MAQKKYNWEEIKRDFYSKKYSSLKKLADAHNISYGYLKKKAAKWPKEAPKEITDIDIEEAQKELDMPEDRKERVRDMYDKLSVIIYRAFQNDDGFFTLDGTLKTKQFLDLVSAIEKIDKGYASGDDGKQTGQLGQYAAFLNKLRENQKRDDK